MWININCMRKVAWEKSIVRNKNIICVPFAYKANM